MSGKYFITREWLTYRKQLIASLFAHKESETLQRKYVPLTENLTASFGVFDLFKEVKTASLPFLLLKQWASWPPPPRFNLIFHFLRNQRATLGCSWQRPSSERIKLLPMSLLLIVFFSSLLAEGTNTAPITHTAAQLEQGCELMSRSGQANEGWRWSAEGWN